MGFLLQTLLPLLFEAFFSRAANKKEKMAAAAGMKSGRGPLLFSLPTLHHNLSSKQQRGGEEEEAFLPRTFD